MKRSFSIMMALMLSLMVVYMSVVADGKNKPLSEEVSRTHGEDEVFDVP